MMPAPSSQEIAYAIAHTPAGLPLMVRVAGAVRDDVADAVGVSVAAGVDVPDPEAEAEAV